ncbi:HipA domain-containing protein, partial [Cronobacter dublinensis subsp. dublinensis]|nr:HipA domain-containing protein [Cronobacter dublinensis subsp. dublinensis]
HAQADRAHFFRAQIIFWILAATDGHAKNFSIAHLPGNRYHLTPLYDVLSAWPVIGPGNHQIAWQKCKLAMAVRGSSNYYHLSQIRRRHWLRQGELAGLSPAQVTEMIDELIAATPAAVARAAEALPAGFPSALAGQIFDGMRQQCARLASA